jgi:hypothetical protein
MLSNRGNYYSFELLIMLTQLIEYDHFTNTRGGKIFYPVCLRTFIEILPIMIVLGKEGIIVQIFTLRVINDYKILESRTDEN